MGAPLNEKSRGSARVPVQEMANRANTSPHRTAALASPHCIMNTEGNSRKDRLFTDLSDFLGIPLPRVLLLDDLVHAIFQVYVDFVSNSAFRGIDEPYSTLLYSTLLDFTLPLLYFTLLCSTLLYSTFCNDSGHSGSGIIEFQDWEPLGGLPGNTGDNATSLS